MTYNIGDFVSTDKSQYPALIIKKDANIGLLASIVEYNGDYIWLDPVNVEEIDLRPEEKLSIVAKFSDFFYDMHTALYQELIIENIHIY